MITHNYQPKLNDFGVYTFVLGDIEYDRTIAMDASQLIYTGIEYVGPPVCGGRG